MKTNKRKICVVTGTRADYGLLYPVMQKIDNDPEFQLQLIATGMHLSPEFGLTYKVIKEDGFKIDYRVEMLLSSDTAEGTAKSIGLGIIGFADAFSKLQPDLVIILGDRFEVLPAAQAALVAKIPLAHIAGGDTTEGAYDEAIRHSITKMSHLHFVTNELSAKRVRQLGENPKHVFNVGSPGLDYVNRMEILSKIDLEKAIGFEFKEKNLLITFHPVTLKQSSSNDEFQELLDALEELGDEVGFIFTMPNADTGGRSLIKMVDQFVGEHPYAKAYTSLGQRLYLSTMANVDVVVGNSSSGLYEAPAIKIPAVNIGDRQKGRLKASSVIDCEPEAEKIKNAIQNAFNMDCSDVVNPYGEGNSSEKILFILKEFTDYKMLLKKSFHIMG